TINAIRERSHWNIQNIQPKDPVTLGLCSQRELDAAVAKAAKRVGPSESEQEAEPEAEIIDRRDDREKLIEELRAEREAAAKAAVEAAQEAEAEAWLEAKRAAEAACEACTPRPSGNSKGTTPRRYGP